MILYTTDTNGFQIVARMANNPNAFGNNATAYSVSVSDPSSTCTFNSANNILVPNGSGNTGTVTVTVEDTATSVSTTAVVNVLKSSGQQSGGAEGILVDFVRPNQQFLNSLQPPV